jgi:hypothetical protein
MEIRHAPPPLSAFAGNKLAVKKFTILAMILLFQNR